MTLLAAVSAIVAGLGILQVWVGVLLVRRFQTTAAPVSEQRPPITVLKPLHGSEPLLEDALETLLTQRYPKFQIVFGVQSPHDPAIDVVRRLMGRYPDVDIGLVIDTALHGRNRKVGNLINMLPTARHEVLVIADSDVHAAPDYLSRIADALARPGVGLVTTLYAGLPANDTLVGALGSTAISHGFLPGALMARALGRQDCLGATMALHRDTLASIGGLQALVQHLADDHVLGRLVVAQGLRVGLAATVPATTVPEASIGALYRHELRWSRTILALAPRGFALSAVQYPLAWAILAAGLSGGSGWALGLLFLVWVARGFAVRALDQMLGLARRGHPYHAQVWLLPLRDILSVAVMLASYTGDEVEWRGHVLRASLLPPNLAVLDTLPVGTER